MSVRVRAGCPTCGPVLVLPEAVVLVICNRPEKSYYAFHCPRCHGDTQKPAPELVISLLRAEVTVLHWTVPIEEPAPPLSVDDLIDLCLELGTTDLLAAELQP